MPLNKIYYIIKQFYELRLLDRTPSQGNIEHSQLSWPPSSLGRFQ